MLATTGSGTVDLKPKFVTFLAEAAGGPAMRCDWLSSRIGLVLALATACGCAGAGVTIVADRAVYPISMSGSVRDNTGTLHDARSLKIVGSFDVEESRFGLVYSTTTVHEKLDISDAINSQVQAAGGEAVIRLSVTVDDSCHWRNELFPLTVLPFWPGCVPVKIHGAIVRRTLIPPSITTTPARTVLR